jgi:phosphatidate phosphatase APP1
VEDFPEVRWVLVGDDGQHDPEIYAGLVRRRPDRVHAVVIRQLTGAEHVLAHGVPTSTDQANRAEGRTQAEGVPVVQGADGTEILTEWRTRGVTLR